MPGQPSNFELTIETVRFFGWLISSIVISAGTLIGIYLRLYIHDALQAHAAALREITAIHYVRKDVHEQEIRRLEAMIEGAG
jgi:hypothetical protein